jgi:hypothetical protein
MARRTELAPHPAARLRGDAQRIAVVVFEPDRLDSYPVGQVENEFDRAVRIVMPFRQGDPRDGKALFGQLVSECFGQGGYVVDVRCVLLVDERE